MSKPDTTPTHALTTGHPTNEPSPAVALETTLLVHGVPAPNAITLYHDLCADIVQGGGEPKLVGVYEGRARVDLGECELAQMIKTGASVPKANTSNLGVLAHWGATAATTVSATMEIAHANGICVFATGGLGGVHRGYGCRLDVSSDLAAFTRFPVAVVCSGVKSILDVISTREALEALGVPVVGYRTDSFPAFYTRASEVGVDARFDDVRALADFLRAEFARAGRGVVVAQPVPEAHEIPRQQLDQWIERAEDEAEDAEVEGRAVTPFVLAKLHEWSQGQTLHSNIALVRNNAKLAGSIARAIAD